MYMNRQHGSLLGNTLGEVEDIEVDTDDTRWGPFLRLRVQINLKKALARRRSLEVRVDKVLIPIRYEKLPRFCFSCGKIIHDSDCHKEGEQLGQNQFGSWLRVESQRRREQNPTEVRQSHWSEKQLESNRTMAPPIPAVVNGKD